MALTKPYRITAKRTDMREILTMGDMFTKAQLSALEKGIKADQREGLPLRLRKKAQKSEMEEIRSKVQWQRHKKQAGDWVSKKPYITQEEAQKAFNVRESKREERKAAKCTLETGAQMFNTGKGVRTKKRVSDHVGEKIGSYLHVIRFANSKVTIVCKSKKTF